MPFGRLLLVALSALAVVAMVAGPAAAVHSTFFTDLNGAEEVPGPGDPDGRGLARIEAYPSDSGVPLAGNVCYDLAVDGIKKARAAHIHEAPAGVAGPVVVTLEAPRKGYSSGCVFAPQVADGLIEDSTDYYVNVHNKEYPAGALRGQL